MSDEDWESGFGRSIVVFLNGEGIPDLDRRGGRVTDDSFLMCFNAHDDEIETTLPNGSYGSRWTVVLDTATGAVAEPNGGPADSREIEAGTVLPVPARSLIVLQRTGIGE
jgi:glycogen operon protein